MDRWLTLLGAVVLSPFCRRNRDAHQYNRSFLYTFHTVHSEYRYSKYIFVMLATHLPKYSVYIRNIPGIYL